MTPKLHHIFPESCLLIVVGIVIGFLLFWTSEHDPPSTLTPDVFFLFMLPPIIFDAGYFMPNRLFFDHLGNNRLGRIHLPLMDRPAVKCVIEKTFFFFIKIQ